MIDINYNILNNTNLKIDLPYPKIEVNENNIKLANLIKESYCGSGSEMTAINQYVYEMLIENNAETKHSLDIISQVEMKHLDILANLIKNLGLTPTFITINKNSNIDYWNTSLINYTTDPLTYLKNNILAEEAAIVRYQNIINNTNNHNIIEVIKRIILDEERHIEIFKMLLKNHI